MLSRIVIPIAILATGAASWFWLSEPVETPKPEHQARQRLKTERLVLTPTDYRVVLDSQGSVKAHHMTTVTAQISGKIIHIHPCFEDGAFFKQGQVLAEIDPADLKAEHATAQSRLARAEASLAQEEARAKQAELNWQDMGYQEEPSPLVLRIPQLKEAKALVAAAQAEVDQSSRNLERTQIRAPFDGRVKTRSIGLGQAINPTTPLGEVFATDFAEVRLPLAPNQLPFVKLPTKEGDPHVNVTLTNALGSDKIEQPTRWQARIVRTEGTLDESSRELFVIARIDDPFGLHQTKPELRIGQPVRAEIEGIILNDVYVIPRSAMRGINRIYLINPEKSSIISTEIKPVWSNLNEMVVRNGISPGDWLAVSPLPYAPDDAPVDIIQPNSTPQGTIGAKNKNANES